MTDFQYSLHPAALEIDKLLENCQTVATRGSGPGGQHRNKTSSAIVITHIPTGVVGQASERRSQHENRAVAIQRLRLNLALAVRCAVNIGQVPSPLWQSRVKGGSIKVSESHGDYPSLFAEALDYLENAQNDVAESASRLGVTSSQLIKFIKTIPEAFQRLNEQREKNGMGRLK